MERNKKTDEVLYAATLQVKALLIGRNFLENSVSNIAERSGGYLHYANRMEG